MAKARSNIKVVNADFSDHHYNSPNVCVTRLVLNAPVAFGKYHRFYIIDLVTGRYYDDEFSTRVTGINGLGRRIHGIPGILLFTMSMLPDDLGVRCHLMRMHRYHMNIFLNGATPHGNWLADYDAKHNYVNDGKDRI